MPTVEELEASLAAANVALEEAKGKLGTTSAEAKAHRLKAERFEGELTAAQAAALATATEAAGKLAAAETAVTEVRTASQARVVTAELKIAAIAAGARDAADILAMIPRDQVTLDKDGEPTNHAELIAAIKVAKPYLFGAASTASSFTPPKPAPDKTSVKDMSDADYKAAKAAALKR